MPEPADASFHQGAPVVVVVAAPGPAGSWSSCEVQPGAAGVLGADACRCVRHEAGHVGLGRLERILLDAGHQLRGSA